MSTTALCLGAAIVAVALIAGLLREFIVLRHRLDRAERELHELRRDAYHSRVCDDALVAKVGSLDAAVRLHLGDVLRGAYRR